MKIFRFLTPLLLTIVAVFCFAPAAWAFCGFYVAKADTKLYNKASQVVIARNGDRTVLTMANDFQGEVKDFAIVVPVPTVLQKDQVRLYLELTYCTNREFQIQALLIGSNIRAIA